MEVIINKDITKYKIERWKGLSVRQIIIGIGLLVSVVGGIIFFFFICKVPLLISSIMITPVAFGLVLFGFYEPDGMSFWAYLKKRWNRKILVYCSIREEVQEDTGIEPANRIQRLRARANRVYSQVLASRLGIRITQAYKLGKIAVQHVSPVIKHVIKLLLAVLKKIKQSGAANKKAENNKKKTNKEEGKEAE